MPAIFYHITPCRLLSYTAVPLNHQGYGDKPHAMVCLNIIAADTDEDAQRLATTLQQQFLNLMRGNEVPLQPPVDHIHDIESDYEIAALENQLGSSILAALKR